MDNQELTRLTQEEVHRIIGEQVVAIRLLQKRIDQLEKEIASKKMERDRLDQ